MRKSLFLAFVLSCLAAAPAQSEPEVGLDPLIMSAAMEAAPKFCNMEFNRSLREAYEVRVAREHKVITRDARRMIRDQADILEFLHVRGGLDSLCEIAGMIHDRYRVIYQLPRRPGR